MKLCQTTSAHLGATKTIVEITYPLVSTAARILLTLARVGGAEGYCNQSVCLSVCLFFPKIPANL